MVDEFQDTSGTQNELVQLLTNYWEQPNLFVVGDDDQSIFRFQGANVENMLHFQTQFKDDIVNIVLEQNYRSTQPILDASTQVINQNQERLINKIGGLSKNLIASLPENQSINIAPSILQYNDPQEEMMDITEKLQNLLRAERSPKKLQYFIKNINTEQKLHIFTAEKYPYL